MAEPRGLQSGDRPLVQHSQPPKVSRRHLVKIANAVAVARTSRQMSYHSCR